jgi:hypothetical protein
VRNTLAYYGTEIITTVKKFYNIGTTEYFTVVIGMNWADVFL